MIDDKGYLIKANLYDGLDCDDDIIFYQNDTKQSKIVAEFTGKKRAAIDVADCTVVCVIQKSDKEIVTAYMENDFNVTNRAEYVLSQNALASTGKGIITIFVYGSDNERQTFGSIKFKVLKDVNSGSVESTTEYPVLTKLISDTKVVVNDAENAKNEILGVSADIANSEKQRVSAETKREENESSRINEFAGIKKEYESLKSIMIDKNNAANLQNQINEANSQLGNIAKYQLGSQRDFVKLLSDLSSYKKNMCVKIDVGNLKQFSIHIKQSDTKGIAYYFRRDGQDDYILLMEGVYGNVVNDYGITDTKNYDSRTGTFFEYAPNYYTKNVGDSIQISFKGTGIAFNAFCNNQGGLWEAVLDEGTASEQREDISVYNATPVTKPVTLFSNLNFGKHTVKMIFKGQDDNNPVSDPRGWLYFGGTRPQDTSRTFSIYNDTFYISKEKEIMYSYSNKDFAISCRPFESTGAYEFIPEHNAKGSAFNLQDTKLLVNGQEVIWNTGNYYNDIETVQLIQKVKGCYPSDLTNPLAEIYTIHTVKNGSVAISGKIKWLRKTSIDVGYTGMMPYFCSFANQIVTGIGNIYNVKTDGSKEYWNESDKCYSTMAINNGSDSDLFMAMTFPCPSKTFRNGLENRGEPFSWIEHRGTTMGKLYFQMFKNATMEIGDIYNFDVNFIVGSLPNVNYFLT